MSNSKLSLTTLLVALTWGSLARAQQPGFAVERLYPSAPGGGWIVKRNS